VRFEIVFAVSGDFDNGYFERAFVFREHQLERYPSNWMSIQLNLFHDMRLRRTYTPWSRSRSTPSA
jgi:hypothetical protein